MPSPAPAVRQPYDPCPWSCWRFSPTPPSSRGSFATSDCRMARPLGRRPAPPRGSRLSSRSLLRSSLPISASALSRRRPLPILRPTHLATRPQDATPSSGHHREMRRPGRQKPTGLTEPPHPGLHLAGNHEHQPPLPPAEIQDPARRETFALENPIQLLAEPRTHRPVARSPWLRFSFASGAPLSSLAAIRRGVQHARGRSKFL